MVQRPLCIALAVTVSILAACGDGSDDLDVGVGPAPDPDAIAELPSRGELAPSGFYDSEGCFALADEIEAQMPPPPPTTPLPHQSSGIPCDGNDPLTARGMDSAAYAGYTGPHYLTDDLSGSVEVLAPTLKIVDTSGGIRVAGLVRNEASHWAESIAVVVEASTANSNSTVEVAPIVQPVRPGEPIPFQAEIAGISSTELTSLDVSVDDWTVFDPEPGDRVLRDFLIRSVHEVPWAATRQPIELPYVNYEDPAEGPFPYLHVLEFMYYGSQAEASEVEVWVAHLDDTGAVVAIAEEEFYQDEQVVTSVDAVDRPMFVRVEHDETTAKAFSDGRIAIWVTAILE